MKNDILTSEIEHTHFDNHVLDKRFCAYKIGYGGISKEHLGTRKPQIAAAIHKSGLVLSLADHRGDRAYYALLKQGDDFQFEADDVAIKLIAFSQVPNFISPKLLLMAIPRLLPEHEGTRHKRMNADGLYYLVDTKKIGGGRTQKRMLITVHCSIEADWNVVSEGNKPVNHFAVSGATFKPVEQVTFPDGSLRAKHQRKPRYNLDEWSQIVSRDAQGEYIKEAFDGSKNRVDAVDITNEELDKFELSRVGVLAQCMQDIKDVYGDTFKIRFKRLPKDIHERVTDTKVKKSYDQIWEVMRKFPVNIIDCTGDLQAIEILKTWLDRDRFLFQESDVPELNHSNLLLVHPKEHYEATGEPDPYKEIKAAYPYMAVQACYPDSLKGAEKDKKNSVFEVLIKELLIKQEVCSKRIIYPCTDLPDDVDFVLPVSSGSKQDKQWTFHRLRFSGGNMSFDTLTEDDLENIADCLDKEHKEYIEGNRWGGGKRPPFLFWPATDDYMFFVESEVVALPEFQDMKNILLEVHTARSHPVDREFLEVFCDDNPGNQIASACRELLDVYRDDSAFEFSQVSEAIKKLKIRGRNKDKEAFYQWVEDELDLVWKRSLKKKQDGFLDANLGFFFNRREKTYYVGAKGAPQQTIANFSKIYKLATTLPEVPDSVVELFKVMHIRHRQMTVLPYPFKYLREYSQKVAD